MCFKFSFFSTILVIPPTSEVVAPIAPLAYLPSNKPTLLFNVELITPIALPNDNVALFLAWY